MSMPDEDSKKMEEIRKFSAIYGRFDAKRKPEKPLTLHEVSYSSEKKTKSYQTNSFSKVLSVKTVFSW